jgi:hypothetical protein
VVQTNLSSETHPKAFAVLHSLYSAVASQEVPDIEFVFSVQRQVAEIKSPLWTFDREEDDDKVWLMPSPEIVWEGPNFTMAPPDASGVIGEKVTKTGSVEAGKTPFKVADENLGALGSPRTRLVAQAEEIDRATKFSDKARRLVGAWRTDGTAGTVRQRALIYMSKGQPWADPESRKGKETGLQGLDGTRSDLHRDHSAPEAGLFSSMLSAPPGSSSTSSAALVSSSSPSASTTQGPVSLTEMCRFSFLAHDSTFNIPIADGPLLCRSVLLTTKPKWIELYHGLMLANDDHLHLGQAEHPVITAWREKGAGKQNVVLLTDDFGDLAFKMEGLLKYPDVAEKIASNFVETFRERYLTRAATACYWRDMIRSYSKVSYKPVAGRIVAGKRDVEKGGVIESSVRSSIGVPWESFR